MEYSENSTPWMLTFTKKMTDILVSLLPSFQGGQNFNFSNSLTKSKIIFSKVA